MTLPASRPITGRDLFLSLEAAGIDPVKGIGGTPPTLVLSGKPYHEDPENCTIWLKVEGLPLSPDGDRLRPGMWGGNYIKDDEGHVLLTETRIVQLRSFEDEAAEGPEPPSGNVYFISGSGYEELLREIQRRDGKPTG